MVKHTHCGKAWPDVLERRSAVKPLDGFEVKILLFSRGEIWSHNVHLQARGDTARENTAKGIEMTFVRGRHHLRDVHHERPFGVTVLETLENGDQL